MGSAQIRSEQLRSEQLRSEQLTKKSHQWIVFLQMRQQQIRHQKMRSDCLSFLFLFLLCWIAASASCKHQDNQFIKMVPTWIPQEWKQKLNVCFHHWPWKQPATDQVFGANCHKGWLRKSHDSSTEDQPWKWLLVQWSGKWVMNNGFQISLQMRC